MIDSASMEAMRRLAIEREPAPVRVVTEEVEPIPTLVPLPEVRPRFVTVDTTLFDRVQIRDTETHYPVTLLPLRGSRTFSFDVHNDHDQAVILHLIGGSGGATGPSGDTGFATTIAANTKEPVLIVNIWAPYLGLSAAYAVSPTAGSLTIIGSVQEENL